MKQSWKKREKEKKKKQKPAQTKIIFLDQRRKLEKDRPTDRQMDKGTNRWTDRDRTKQEYGLRKISYHLPQYPLDT